MRTAVVALSLVAAAHAGVLDLTYPPEKYQESFGDGKATLALFFAPWCSYCDAAVELWDQVAAAVEADPSAAAKLQLVRVDGNENAVASNDYDVTEFPSVRLVKKGSKRGQVFKAGLSIDSVFTFVKDKLGVTLVKEAAVVREPEVEKEEEEQEPKEDDAETRKRKLQEFQEKYMDELNRIADEEGIEGAQAFLKKHGMEKLIRVTSPDHLAGNEGDKERELLRTMADSQGTQAVKDFLQKQGLDEPTMAEVLRSIGVDDGAEPPDPGFDEWEF